MKKKKTRKSNIGLGTLIGIAITALLAVFLFHPNWLPVSEETRNTIKELEKNHFLIQRSGTITIAHVLTVILALLVVWLCYTLLPIVYREGAMAQLDLIYERAGKKGRLGLYIITRILCLIFIALAVYHGVHIVETRMSPKKNAQVGTGQ